MSANADPPVTDLTRSSEVLQAEREIARTRVRVSQSMLALRDAVAKRTDWREWVRERPGVFLGVAFGIGMLWGMRAAQRARAAGR